MSITDKKVEIIQVTHSPNVIRVKARLIPPYLVNANMHFIIPESELLPERLWNMVIHNKDFEWSDEELKYKYITL